MNYKDKADAIAYALRGFGKTVNDRGEEKVMGIPTSRIMGRRIEYDHYGGSRNEGKTMKTRSESMTKPGVQLETDKCGRYNFAKAFMYRDVGTKRNGSYREQIIGYGVARRQHGDPKDPYVGEGLAVSRALEDLGYKLGKRSWGKVKHNDDIKVQRKQQKARRQAQADEQLERFADRCTRTLKVLWGINER